MISFAIRNFEALLVEGLAVTFAHVSRKYTIFDAKRKDICAYGYNVQFSIFNYVQVGSVKKVQFLVQMSTCRRD